MNSETFISVCIDVTGRNDTAIESLKSIQNLNYSNYEVLISLFKEDDEFLDSIRNLMRESSAKFELYINNYYQNRFSSPISAWNANILPARGDYIAILEGDDIFDPEYLSNCNKVLKKYNNIGTYFSQNQHEQSSTEELVFAELALQNLYKFKGIGAPSQTVFRARDYRGKRFMYNENYNWAGEISLYEKIYLSGFDAYYSSKANMVYRRPSVYKKTSFHFTDFANSVSRWRESKLYTGKIAKESLSYVEDLSSTFISNNIWAVVSNIKILILILRISPIENWIFYFGKLVKKIYIHYKFTFINYVAGTCLGKKIRG